MVTTPRRACGSRTRMPRSILAATLSSATSPSGSDFAVYGSVASVTLGAAFLPARPHGRCCPPSVCSGSRSSSDPSAAPSWARSVTATDAGPRWRSRSPASAWPPPSVSCPSTPPSGSGADPAGPPARHPGPLAGGEWTSASAFLASTHPPTDARPGSAWCRCLPRWRSSAATSWCLGLEDLFGGEAMHRAGAGGCRSCSPHRWGGRIYMRLNQRDPGVPGDGQDPRPSTAPRSWAPRPEGQHGLAFFCSASWASACYFTWA